jgi:hypothetical protein
MVERRAGAAIGLAWWTSMAHAHGEEAVLLMLGMVLLILIVPFAAFLFFWRNSVKSKAILGCAYLLALPLALYAALSANFSNDWAFFSVLFGLPLCVWLLGALWLRAYAR